MHIAVPVLAAMKLVSNPIDFNDLMTTGSTDAGRWGRSAMTGELTIHWRMIMRLVACSARIIRTGCMMPARGWQESELRFFADRARAGMYSWRWRAKDAPSKGHGASTQFWQGATAQCYATCGDIKQQAEVGTRNQAGVQRCRRLWHRAATTAMRSPCLLHSWP